MARKAEDQLERWRQRYLIDGHSVPEAVEAALRADPRKRAQSVLAGIEKRRRGNRSEGQRLRHMLTFEQQLWSEGLALVAGVDEAGMSPLAGPVVAAAVILPKGTRIVGVDDSKKLDAASRERLAPVIRAKAIAWAVGYAEVDDIDRVNIYHAGLLAMHRAVIALAVSPEALLIDARKLRDIPVPQQSIVHGDEKSLSIAAASILAKTTRDAHMVELDRAFPGYGFAQHKGYPVPEHYAALERLGACAAHRRSFGPVRRAMGLMVEEDVENDEAS